MAESRRGWRVPANLNCSGVLIAGSAASLTLAASATSAPNVSARPLALCVTLPMLALHSDAGTFHFVAAAWMRRARAEAPACCT